MAVSDLVFKVAERTHVGRVRTMNEDDVWHGQTPIGFFYIVADGMGGHAAGEVASNLVVTLLMERAAHSNPNDDPVAIMKDAMFRANMRIFRKAAMNPELYGMGSTAVSILVRDGLAYVSHVGDSRAYLMRDRKLHRLTTDHTLVQMLVNSGIMSQEEAEKHPRSHILNQAVGCHPDAVVDILEKPVELTGGDVLMLCSDGLSGLVSDEEISLVLQTEENPDLAADRLVQMALAAGGTDNVTVQVIKTIGPKEKVPAPPKPRRETIPPEDLEDTKRIILGELEPDTIPLPNFPVLIAGSLSGLLLMIVVAYLVAKLL